MTDGPVMARRQYALPDGTVATVSIGTPHELVDAERVMGPDVKWACKIESSGLSAPVSQTVYGVDSLDVIVMALGLLRQSLEVPGSQIEWMGMEPGDSGIPKYVLKSFGLEFENRIVTLMDEETMSWIRTHRPRK